MSAFIKKIFLTILYALLTMPLIYGQTQKNFTVNFNTIIGPIKPLANVTAGPGQSLAGYQDARIKMIRTNDYFGPCDFPYYTNFFQGDSINPSFNPIDSNNYYWHNTDSVLSINYNNGFETFFRLGISYNLTDSTPYWDPPYDYGTQNYTKITEVFKRTVMHYNDGWDNGFNYNIRYWNVWTEPDGNFWNFASPALTYFKMYASVSSAIKSYDPTLKVGGAGFLSPSVTNASSTYIPDFIGYCKVNSVPLDFLSWHLYGQHNPYAIYVYANKIRTLLDTAGFTNVKSFITETNIDLGVTNSPDLDSPKGAAWLASSLITAQYANLDRLIMYRGNAFMNLLNNDVNGLPSYTWNGLGFKSFSVLADEAPTQIDAQGSVFISDTSTMEIDTTNIMILASKTTTNNDCYTLISNYNSSYTSYNVKIINLPWPIIDSIRVTQYLTKPGTRFVESVSTYPHPVNDTLEINLQNMGAPSVILLKMSRIITTGVNDLNNIANTFVLEQNYPNPFRQSTVISFQIPVLSKVTLTVYDVLGREVKTLVNEEKRAGDYKINFDVAKLENGVYYYSLSAKSESGNFVQTKKMTLLR